MDMVHRKAQCSNCRKATVFVAYIYYNIIEGFVNIFAEKTLYFKLKSALKS